MKKLKVFIGKIWTNYKKRTPDQWRRFGDVLLLVSATIAGSSFFMESYFAAFVVQFIGVIGKFLTDFYSVDENDQP